MATQNEQLGNGRARSSDNDPRDRRLLASIALADRDAMLALHDDYYPKLFRFLHRLTHDHGVTEELVNDVMMVVWRDAGRFRGASKVSTWILGIAYRLALKRLRRRKLRQMLRLDGREPFYEQQSGMEASELCEKALRQLSPEHRLMIEYVLYLGLSYSEVAEIAQCPVILRRPAYTTRGGAWCTF